MRGEIDFMRSEDQKKIFTSKIRLQCFICLARKYFDKPKRPLV